MVILFHSFHVLSPFLLDIKWQNMVILSKKHWDFSPKKMNGISGSKWTWMSQGLLGSHGGILSERPWFRKEGMRVLHIYHQWRLMDGEWKAQPERSSAELGRLSNSNCDRSNGHVQQNEAGALSKMSKKRSPPVRRSEQTIGFDHLQSHYVPFCLI